MSRILSHTVPREWEGRTVQEFARRYLGLSSRAFIRQKHLENGLLKNGIPCRSIDRLSAGDRLEICLPEESQTYEPVEMTLSILWEDADYLIVNKPFHCPVHPLRAMIGTVFSTGWHIIIGRQASLRRFVLCTGWIETRRVSWWWERTGRQCLRPR